MSRCFPFPPPAYERKDRIDDIDLLAKVYMLSFFIITRFFTFVSHCFLHVFAYLCFDFTVSHLSNLGSLVMGHENFLLCGF